MTSSSVTQDPMAAKPVRKDVARNRTLLLEAADELFGRQGSEVTLDEIARHAGVGVATAYRHFANKQALLVALFEGRIDRIVENMLAAERLADPREAFESFLYRSCEMQAADRGMRDAAQTDLGLPDISLTRDRLAPIAERIVERAKAAGVLRPEFDVTDIPLLFVMIGSVSDYSYDVSPTLWRRYLDFLLDGLMAAGTPHRPISAPALQIPQIEIAMQKWHRPAARGRSDTVESS